MAGGVEKESGREGFHLAEGALPCGGLAVVEDLLRHGERHVLFVFRSDSHLSAELGQGAVQGGRGKGLGAETAEFVVNEVDALLAVLGVAGEVNRPIARVGKGRVLTRPFCSRMRMLRREFMAPPPKILLRR